jgi:nucleotide-binding universal stress UspA family protein
MIIEGDFAKSILKTAKELQADFIILASHSRHTSIPLFIISTKKTELD